MTNILEGIKVIEVSSMAAAPTTGVLLADFGAEVIKVEPPTGDPWRFANQLGGMPPSKIPYTTYIRNRTKKSVALNLKNPDAQAALHKLVETADVFLTNSPLKVQSACGHTYEVIRKVNPKIVYAWINGFGMKGPDKDLPGFDMTAWYARCGLAEEFRPKDGDPVPQPIAVGDTFTGTTLFAAVMVGLFHRQRTGESVKVTTSLLNNGLWANSEMVQAALAGAPPMVKYRRDEWPQAIMGGNYRTKDGRNILIVELNPNNAAGVADALGADYLKKDERFKTEALRNQNHRALFAELEKVFGAMDLSEASARLKKGRVNHGVLQTTAECTTDEHMIANGCFPEIEGTPGHRTIDSPLHVEGIEKVKPRKVSKIGGDTVAELKAVGYSEETIQKLAEAGAVGLPR